LPDDQKPAVPLDVQIRAVGREIGMRRGAYAKWVKSGRMTQDESDRELAAMEAVYQTLQNLKRGTP
jgi:hypothetical protein